MPRGLFMWGHLPTARFTKFLPLGRNPSSSIPRQNTSGTWLFRPTELSTSPLVTKDKSSPSRLMAKVNFFIPATKLTFAFWPSAQTETSSQEPSLAAAFFGSPTAPRRSRRRTPKILPRRRPMVSFCTKLPSAKSLPLPSQPTAPSTPPRLAKSSALGAPEELWSSREDVVYALGLASDGRLLAGSGNNGALLAVDGHGVFANLAKSGTSQITGIARNSSGKVFLCTANPGKVFSVGPEYEAEGTFESRSFDAQLFSHWGRIEWWSPPPSNTARSSASSNEPRVEFFVRSGNTADPGREWSRWFGPYAKSGAATEAPSARFVQWKAVIHDGRPGDGIDWVNLAYLPRNVAPVIDGIALQDPGVRAQSQSGISTNQPTPVILKTPPSPNVSGVIITQSSTPPRFEQSPQGTQQKGYQSVLWTAHDDNDDEMRYSVYFRGENEHEWKLLKDNLEQKFYSWDTTTLPDGAYYLKIAATDAPSNPPALAIKTERESERFEVDNTPPVVENLVAVPHVRRASASPSLWEALGQFTARDAGSSVDRAQYSIDGGEWIRVAPTSGISDAPEERYEFSFGGLSPGEHTVAVRAYDRFENVGSAKTTFTVPAAKP